MNEGHDGGEKTHEPSRKRLEDARHRGELPRSADLNGAAALAGLILAFVWSGAQIVDEGGVLFAGWVERAAARPVPAGAGRAFVLQSLAAALPLLFVPAIAVLASIAAQRAFVFAPEKLRPQLSRISPLAQARQRFGWSGLFEFAKSTVKLLLVSLVAGAFLMAQRDVVLGSLRGSPGQVALAMGQMLTDFLVIMLLVGAAIAALDYLWQVHDHRRKHRMSHKELRDEAKEAEGDPHLKQERRRRGHAIATNRMLAEVPKADVVVVNPEHYAVALRWERASGRVPVCVAKGVDAVAQRIRSTAAEAGVPLRRDPPTARALHASVEIGEEIRPEHYHAVAAAIRFAERMRGLARDHVR